MRFGARDCRKRGGRRFEFELAVELRDDPLRADERNLAVSRLRHVSGTLRMPALSQGDPMINAAPVQQQPAWRRKTRRLQAARNFRWSQGKNV